jgi:galactokinase
LLQQTPCTEQTAMLLGELMYQSHASYSACGLGATATDAIVEAIRTHGPAHGLYGAKITGGGSGGTVAVLGRPEALPLVRRIAEQHATGLVFTGSSDGAVARAVVKWVAQ